MTGASRTKSISTELYLKYLKLGIKVKDCLIIIQICCFFLLSVFMPLILIQGNFEGIFE